MKQFIVEEQKTKVKITPLKNIKGKQQLVIKNAKDMSLKEIKQQISENYNVDVNDIDLLLV